jgi:iron complex outermembrane recepter protein
MSKVIRFLGLCVAAAAVCAAPALADDAASQPQSDNSIQLQEVTVRAMRVAEPLQQVPVAVSVLTGAQAAAMDLNNIQDMSAVLPTVDFRTGASNKDRDIFIRGIGTITTSPGDEPSVSTVVDGVAYDRPGMATSDMLDIDHVEVLRGPQGTLFGLNAAGGVINVVTTDPTDQLSGYADGSYFGGGGEERFKAGVSGPIDGDKVLGLISGLYTHYEGNVDNLFNGQTLNGYVRYGTHTKLIIKPSDRLRVMINADYLQSRDTVPTGVFASSGQEAYPSGIVTANPGFAAVLASSGVTPSYENTEVSQNVNSHTRDENGGVSMTLDYALDGGYTLTSITAYRKWQNHQVQDYDQIAELTTAFPQVIDNGYLSFYQVSQEARITSPRDQFFSYQGGIYFLRGVDTELYRRDIVQLTAAGADVPNDGIANYGTQSSNYSLYGEGNLNFTSSFRGIIGVRAIRDTLDYQHARVSTSPVAVPGISPNFGSSGSTGNYNYSDRVGLQYDLSPNVHGYITYSRGYTGPAYNVFFNMGATATGALKPETSNDYELGLKSLLLGDRLQLDAAVFLTQFNNYQANFQTEVAGALVTTLVNAGTVSTQGVELDYAYRPIEDFTLRGAAAWDRAFVDQFNCPSKATESCNINGQPLPFAPEWKVEVDGNYIIRMTDALQMILDSDYHWQSKVQYQLTETADTIQGAYGIWDASIAVANPGKGWRVSGVLKNIANRSYSSYLAHGDLAGVVRWVPRDASRYGGVEVSESF